MVMIWEGSGAGDIIYLDLAFLAAAYRLRSHVLFLLYHSYALQGYVCQYLWSRDPIANACGAGV